MKCSDEDAGGLRVYPLSRRQWTRTNSSQPSASGGFRLGWLTLCLAPLMPSLAAEPARKRCRTLTAVSSSGAARCRNVSRGLVEAGGWSAGASSAALIYRVSLRNTLRPHDQSGTLTYPISLRSGGSNRTRSRRTSDPSSMQQHHPVRWGGRTRVILLLLRLSTRWNDPMSDRLAGLLLYIGEIGKWRLKPVPIVGPASAPRGPAAPFAANAW